MAIQRNGSSDMTGKTGNTVTYKNKWGDTIQRTIGVKDGSKGGEFSNQQGTAIVTKVLKSMKNFLDIGFKNVPKGKRWYPYNYASSYNKINAVVGTYPDKEIDFSRFKVSKGDMALPLNGKVALVGNYLEFSWDADLESEGNQEYDQVMLLVYFRESNQSISLIGGAWRHLQKEKIKLTKFTKHSIIEVYMAFVSNDRNRVSDSVHLGQIIREA